MAKLDKVDLAYLHDRMALVPTSLRFDLSLWTFVSNREHTKVVVISSYSAKVTVSPDMAKVSLAPLCHYHPESLGFALDDQI
jgi:hypothetical protein